MSFVFVIFLLLHGSIHKTVDKGVTLVNVDVQDKSAGSVDLDPLCMSIGNSRPMESVASSPDDV